MPLRPVVSDAKYGDMSRGPFITPARPRVFDDSVTPPSEHIVNLFDGHAPTS
jgi:hypothetical protein